MHSQVPAVDIEFVHAVRRDPSGRRQGTVDDRCVVAAGDEEAVFVRCRCTVVHHAFRVVHVVGTRYARERDRLPQTFGRAEVHDFGVERCDDRSGRAGLCQIASAGLQGDPQDLFADGVGDSLDFFPGVDFLIHRNLLLIDELINNC